MPHSAQRRNRAFKIAYLADIQRILYSVSLSAFCHSWAMLIIAKLIPSAYTVLMFLSALHRCGRNGYIGCAIAYDLLAPQIVKATGRKCAPRTLKRGLAFLHAFGLVELRPWTMPDQRIRIGDRTVVVRGTARVDLGSDTWCTRQLRVIVLTDLAVALWDKSTKSCGDRYIPHYATGAKLAPRSHDDQCVNTHMVDQESSKQLSPSFPPKTRSDNVPSSTLASPKSSSRVSKGRSTRPACPTCVPADLEHQASTPNKPDHKTKSQLDTGGAFEGGPGFQAGTKPDPCASGCSRPYPRIPRGAPRTWNLGRLYILAELHRALKNFSTRQADSVFDRARFELSRNYPAGWPTTCDWAYWVGRYPKFQPAQRRYHMMRDILPLLKTPAAITPQEPTRYRKWTKEPGRAPAGVDRRTETGEGLPSLLSRLWEKFCGED